MTATRGSRSSWQGTRSGACRWSSSRTGGDWRNSNAILLHFAEGTKYLPAEPFDRAKVYEWMFFEQYEHEPTIAVSRSVLTAPSRAHLKTPERLADCFERGTPRSR